MSRLPLSTFLPSKNAASISRLIDYIACLKPKERYELTECLKLITSTEMIQLFCREALAKDLYPTGTFYLKGILEANDPKPKKVPLPKDTTYTRGGTKEVSNIPNDREKMEKLKKMRKRKNSISRSHSWSTISKLKNAVAAAGVATTTITNETTVEKQLKYLGTNVPGSGFTVEEGCIKRGPYKLKSVRIPAIPKEVIQEITRTFSIRLDVAKHRSNDKNRFCFVPATDLTVFLEEATRVSIRLGIGKNYVDKPIADANAIELPWSNVLFYEGGMYLTAPDARGLATINPFKYQSPLLHRHYNDFKEYFIKNVRKFQVVIKDGKVTQLLNFEAFKKIIPHLTEYGDVSEQEVLFERLSSVGKSFSLAEFRERGLHTKSPYLSYLSKLQVPEYKIHYLLENVVHVSSYCQRDEFGYLFVIRENVASLVLVYENVAYDSRSSLVFTVRKSQFEKAVNFISRLLSSEIENKREKFARRSLKITEPSIIQCGRVSHTVYNEWRDKINGIRYYGQ